MIRTTLSIMPAIFAVYIPMCAPQVASTKQPSEAPMSQFWEKPTNLPAQDLYYGPWGREHAPDPNARYTFVAKKQTGTNPGMTVKDPSDREWSVKQPPLSDRGAEGPVEVALSRVLSAVGYHQPPVYFVPDFVLADAAGTRREQGGRFRLKLDALTKTGDWSWQQNPFVSTKPYQGLLVILAMFDSSDLKNVNNSLYQVRTRDDWPQMWYVVRDLGTALGNTGRITPKRNDPDVFERYEFIKGVKNGYVQFHYHGWHQELLDERITPDDVEWATELLAGLSDQQWRDAFRAGGYEPAVADRFIRRLQAKIAEGARVALTAPRIASVATVPASSR